MNKNNNKDKILLILDDAMRFGAALGSFKEVGRDENRPWLAHATGDAFRVAQEAFIEEIESIIENENQNVTPN